MKLKILYALVFIYVTALTLPAQVVPGSIVEETIPPYLATPAANCIKVIPVVIIRYLPTTDGVNIDVAQATDYWSLGYISLDDLKSNIDTFDKRVKFALEEGSKYHGYKDPVAIPYLGYKIVKYLTVYRQMQPGMFLQDVGEKKAYQADYHKEFADLDLVDFIRGNMVREVWMWVGDAASPGWPSYDPAIHAAVPWYVWIPESNMSSPSTGDISNSYRYPDDLPVSDHSYVVYGQNFRRSQAEAVHNHGHQLESIYKYANERQDGNHTLFLQDFSGWGSNDYSMPPLGRVGDCHHPPNTTQDYDYLNSTLVESDIEDWRPAGGTKKQVNADTWGNIIYNWPGEPDFGQRVETQWYVYWMQNMPGYNNGIPYQSNTLTNWWQLTADWDFCYNNSIGLYNLNSRSINKPISAGWTWFSLNMESPDMTVAQVLGSLNPVDGDYIKNQTVSAMYYSGFGWFGDLKKMNCNEMYKVKLSHPASLVCSGSPIDLSTASISIRNGWNWIGYPYQLQKTVSEMLSVITPATDDFIKNQTLSSTYYPGTGWFGEMENMNPMDGYMLRTNHTATLFFPETTSGTFTDGRDGKIYSWVKAGIQTWMAENLAYLPAVSPPAEGSVSTPFFYVIEYSGSSVTEAKTTPNYSRYGALYNWEAAKTACPDGWHLPLDGELKILERYLGMSVPDTDVLGGAERTSGSVGQKIKSVSGWISGGNGDNSSGLSVMAAGAYYYSLLDFGSIGDRNYLWSASDFDPAYANCRNVFSGSDGLQRERADKANGFSVRCLKND